MAQRATVLVTGARGFVAKHCIAALLERGYRVVGTLRRLADGEEVREAVAKRINPEDRLSFVEADLLADRGWAEAVAGCRHLLHVASPYPIKQPRRADDLVRTAREGTLRVLRAATAGGVQRVVLTSSVVAVASARPDKTDFDESDWSDAASPNIRPYDLSKTLAERAAWDYAAGSARPELSVILAGQAFGPALDRHVKSSGDYIRSLFGGRYPVVVRFGFPVVDIRDVATAHVAAMEKPAAAGQRFIVADGFLWMIEIARILREAFPTRSSNLPRRELPHVAARLLSHVVPEIRFVRHDIGRLWRMSHAKAERVLGITPSPARDAVLAMAESLIALGEVR